MKRTFSGAFFVLALLLLGQSPAASQASRPAEAIVNVASTPPFSVTSWPIVVADRAGFFRREGIQVKLNFTFTGHQLLAGDLVQFVNAGAQGPLLPAMRGKDIVFVAPIAGTVTTGILAGRDIGKVTDLEGKAFAVSGLGNTDHFVIAKFMERQGLSPSKVKFIGIRDEGAALAQLTAGHIAAGKFDQGKLFRVEQTRQFNILATPTDLGGYPWNVIATTRTYATQNRAVVVGFIRAFQSAMRFIQDPANKEAVIAAVMAAASGLERDVVEQTYAAAKGFELYSLKPLTVSDLKLALEALVFAGEDVKALDLSRFIDNAYLQQAQAKP
jgi:ABC-type nitrate/sulfonate/bicarbonate transport system substrate-binding protein